ncbi:Mad3/BUB1 homology region 1-domain-containing protein [Coniochaeta sp. 2T2.1]|nr:Mad3/BUB1 homology region 1-domain-containing protein [Coniochaeta sp. 2T2.1]
MSSDDLISFDLIESQKENIQSLPSGRSARKLAEAFGASPLSSKPLQPLSAPAAPSDTRTINDHIRSEFEAELLTLSESDDPLDIYDRYVRWTLDAYPSAQATAESQLATLLERATKAFVGSAQYKNDPRYLKMWLHYVRFFSDSPRETYVFLSRHGIGEGLALYYEEFAAWLEGAGRWAQAEEVYKLGIEREARPVSRLVRKFGEFEARWDVHRANGGEDVGGGESALPVARAVLAERVDPFAAEAVRDPQAAARQGGVGGGAKPAKAKMAIFSDAGSGADAGGPGPVTAATTKGWESIGSMKDRKKENVVEAKPWVGETLKAGGKKTTGAAKLAVFRDPSLDKTISSSHIAIRHAQHQVTVNARGQKERVFVDLREVYPTPEEPGTELSFEEVWAAKRGWLNRTWPDDTVEDDFHQDENDENRQVDLLAEAVSEKLVVHHDVVMLDENGAPIFPHKSKPKKKKPVEVNETQIIKAKLDSPSGPKFRKRNASAEPTMTLHTKAAHDDIYDIFNQPIKQPTHDEESNHGDDYDTDDYTSGAESTGTTRNISTSEVGDEDEDEGADDATHEETDETSDVKSVSEWSEFETRKHVPAIPGDEDGAQDEAQDEPEDDQAEEDEDIDSTQSSDVLDVGDEPAATPEQLPVDDEENEALTPIMESFHLHGTRTSFVPIPPEDYVAPTRPYRDPIEAANNRLPFMTPITERTETSLDISAEKENDVHIKSPSRIATAVEEEDSIDLEQLSSPLREVVNEEIPKGRITQPQLQKARPVLAEKKPEPLAEKKSKPLGVSAPKGPKKGPIITDAQCNPVDDVIRNEILANIHPPLASYDGFFDHRTEKFGAGSEIRKFTKAVKSSGRNSVDKTGGLTGVIPPTITFPDSETRYSVKRELGAGAFAPVYLVETSSPDQDEEDDENDLPAMGKGSFAATHARKRSSLEALKMEDPPSAWEFYIMRLAHSRLGPHHRAAASLSVGLELHLYRDEGFLFLPFHPHGTLLDVVNFFRAEASGVMDELLAAFFTVELLRTVEALHAKGLLHGDLKPDNCLLRLEPDAPALDTLYRPDGSGGWDARGLTLIDFGRGIDMRAFKPDVQFIADWKTGPQDCAEMREGRPWTWQVDYHGLASVVHCLLFGKYIETVRVDSGGLGVTGGRKYRIRESLKRYWQTEMWGEVFDLCLNPGLCVEAEEGAKMPLLRGTRRVREKVEAWLEGNCERGVGLKALVGKVEAWASKRK